MQAKQFQILNPIYAFTITALTVKVDIFLTILSPTLYIEKQSEANRVGGRVPDYQLLWNNTGAWSAGHCSKLG